MYIIVGLGNPGKEYEHTRHNAGFDVIDLLSEKYNIPVTTKKFQALIGDGIINNKRVILVKPQTFMNLSGNAVKEVMNFYHLTNEDIMIIYDDIDLGIGNMRIRTKGSAGGHNGMKSIIAQVGSDIFDRIRIGVGEKKESQDLADHVLSKMSKKDRDVFDVTLEEACDAISLRLEHDMTFIMNKYNAKKE